MSLNGWAMLTAPATQVVTKTPAPNRLPNTFESFVVCNLVMMMMLFYDVTRIRMMKSMLMLTTVTIMVWLMMKETSSGRPWPMPAKAEKMSGAPLPRAIIVTPAMFWDNLASIGINYSWYSAS